MMSDDQISVLFEGNDNGQATGDRVAGALFAGWQPASVAPFCGSSLWLR
jgi:hypothetical protein